MTVQELISYLSTLDPAMLVLSPHLADPEDIRPASLDASDLRVTFGVKDGWYIRSADEGSPGAVAYLEIALG